MSGRRKGASAKRRLEFDEAPNPHNQPYYSPAKSSNAPPQPQPLASPPPPTLHVFKDFLGIYFPSFLELLIPQEQHNRVAYDTVQCPIRPHPNNGILHSLLHFMPC